MQTPLPVDAYVEDIVALVRLQADPLLSDFSVIVLDEFHERSIHADLALALAKQAAEARHDLAVVVMSATMDAEPVARFLGARVIDIAARNHPVDIRYRPGLSMVQAVRDVAQTAKGHLLCFLLARARLRRRARSSRG